MSNSACKAVMYHYVRGTSSSMPYLKYLHVEDFRKQLAFFRETYGFIQKQDWLSCIKNKTPPPKGVLLTFDDGLRDHYEFVLPILKEEGLWGTFFLPSGPLKTSKTLNVHAIHYLLARYSSEEVFSALLEIDDQYYQGMLSEQLGLSTAYSEQVMDPLSLQIKKINYAFDASVQDHILHALLDAFDVSTESICSSLYMDVQQARALLAQGHIIGGHSDSHILLPKCTDEELQKEIVDSNKALETITDVPIQSFSYPFGGKDSYDDRVIDVLKSTSIQYAFCVEPRDISPSDLQDRAYTLPRYDCNFFKYGQCRV